MNVYFYSKCQRIKKEKKNYEAFVFILWTELSMECLCDVKDCNNTNRCGNLYMQ